MNTTPHQADDVRVMLCDDSLTARAILSSILDAEPGIRVIHRAADGRMAVDAIPSVKPDVLLLDLEMPVMDGMTALPLLLRASPNTAIIVASALTQRGAKTAIDAMALGAVDYIPKPQGSQGGASDPNFRAELIAKVRGWARMKRKDTATPSRPAATVIAIARQAQPALPTRPQLVHPSQNLSHLHPLARRQPVGITPVSAPVIRLGTPGVAPATAIRPGWRPSILAIGCSTGGPQALAAFVKRLPRLPIPIALVQHMPAGFTTMLAQHLDKVGSNRVAEAVDGASMEAGRIYVAPGDRHMLIEGAAVGMKTVLTSDPPVNFCRPAVDPMMQSAVKINAGRVLGVIMTGMGQDGLEGCRSVTTAGGYVIAQDEGSSVVWGMPGAVAKAGLPVMLGPPEVLADRVAFIVFNGGVR